MPFIQIQNYIANKVILEIIGFTLDVIGKILIGVAVYFVHKRIMKEEKIDKMVLKEIKKEKKIVVLGIILIMIGYLMQLPVKLS